MLATGLGLVTVTVKPQLAVLPDASVAIQLTEVVPIGKTVPDAGEQLKATPEQLSLTAGVRLTTAEHCPGPVGVVMLEGHVICGGVVSRTVTVAVHVPDAPLLSVTVSTTDVSPSA